MGEKLIPLTRAFFNALLTVSEIAILVGKKNASEEPTIGTIEYFFYLLRREYCFNQYALIHPIKRTVFIKYIKSSSEFWCKITILIS